MADCTSSCSSAAQAAATAGAPLKYKPLQLLSWFVTYQTEQKQKHDAVASLPGNRRSRIDSEVDSTDTSARGGLPTSPK